MKKLSKLVLITTVTLLSVITIHAQQKLPATPEERASKLTEWMKTNLQLEDQQVAPVQTINLKYINQVQELHKSAQTKPQKKESLKAIGNAMDQELKGVFTNDQFQKWIAKKDEVKKLLQQKMKAKKKGM